MKHGGTAKREGGEQKDGSTASSRGGRAFHGLSGSVFRVGRLLGEQGRPPCKRVAGSLQDEVEQLPRL